MPDNKGITLSTHEPKKLLAHNPKSIGVAFNDYGGS
jgi:hypothetical protein